ncbi:transcriptional activator NhaR [Azospira restricta]|uniref:transcriptional activator NhaR n=1 Tax=Azospira restricta TaxID=404405 RepID=UPI00193AE660|nr:transcriptional activator NhaR [Azospira restricta]
MPELNYKHLHYFWVVAKEGGVSRAADKLGVAAQTISGQLAMLERSLGVALLAPAGRGLTLTEAGRTALSYADRIFSLGEQMLEALEANAGAGALRLTVGILDALPKLAAHRLLQPVMALGKPLRLVCYEGELDELMSDLALHRLDVVLSDRPVASSGSLRVFSHALGEYAVSFYAAPALAAQYAPRFPASLAGAPLLLPTRTNALRGRLEHWFEANELRPTIVGEFEDAALMDTFGRHGLGLFPALSMLGPEIAAQFGALPVGELDGVREQVFAISGERRIRHPGVEAMLRGGEASPRQ